ncbi:hypothetical protein [Lapillicoccus jejuensis]|uniref:DUF4288 domain-containing protein n=1 Tax=Lapillicoccus jejuensis TaxID=402171 RepID=A0A542E208_9MICO|nr:hypothetical protein [Lapillicoccus jejuensis]TQJ09264.1 hypothetical protein FB458_2374 [Lapillicoccus jejuensis]
MTALFFPPSSRGPEETRRWFAVRCVLALTTEPDAGAAVGTTPYEERVTLWFADSAGEAIELAETEVRDYLAAVDEVDSGPLLSQAYELEGEPGHGLEVFSLIRSSPLPPQEYVDRFFDTGDELQRDVGA